MSSGRAVERQCSFDDVLSGTPRSMSQGLRIAVIAGKRRFDRIARASRCSQDAARDDRRRCRRGAHTSTARPVLLRCFWRRLILRCASANDDAAAVQRCCCCAKVEHLCKAGARADQTDAVGMTPLMLAARMGHVACMAMLVSDTTASTCWKACVPPQWRCGSSAPTHHNTSSRPMQGVAQLSSIAAR
jgi:hypothetical protein